MRLRIFHPPAASGSYIITFVNNPGMEKRNLFTLNQIYWGWWWGKFMADIICLLCDAGAGSGTCVTILYFRLIWPPHNSRTNASATKYWTQTRYWSNESSKFSWEVDIVARVHPMWSCDQLLTSWHLSRSPHDWHVTWHWHDNTHITLLSVDNYSWQLGDIKHIKTIDLKHYVWLVLYGMVNAI